jgi:hypothetical protein
MTTSSAPIPDFGPTAHGRSATRSSMIPSCAEIASGLSTSMSRSGRDITGAAKDYPSPQWALPTAIGYPHDRRAVRSPLVLKGVVSGSNEFETLVPSASSIYDAPPKVRFAIDSALEGDGFDLSLGIQPEENCRFQGLAIRDIVPRLGENSIPKGG